MSVKNCVIWFDFENAPQVLVLEPLIRRFQSDGYEILLTARKFSLTVELCSARNLDVTVVGSGSRSRSKLEKVSRILLRIINLARFIRKHPGAKPTLGVSHASRSQLITGKILSIPVAILDDYEYSDQSLVRFANTLLVPESIPSSIWGKDSGKVVKYPGFKENLYLSGFQPEEVPLLSSSMAKNKVIVLFRPEGRTTHYHSEHSVVLQNQIIKKISSRPNVLVIAFPRDIEQRSDIDSRFKKAGGNVIFPELVDGPSLIANCDLVIGGGGTMTREAAVLGTPSYSFFSGKWGAVDSQLVNLGKLTRISSIEDVKKIDLSKRTKKYSSPPSSTLDFVYNHLHSLAVSFEENAITRA